MVGAITKNKNDSPPNAHLITCIQVIVMEIYALYFLSFKGKTGMKNNLVHSMVMNFQKLFDNNITDSKKICVHLC